jgi:hypothetical protein
LSQQFDGKMKRRAQVAQVKQRLYLNHSFSERERPLGFDALYGLQRVMMTADFVQRVCVL